jgi:alpha-L-rhamnosidase
MNGGFAAFMHESLGGIEPDPAFPGYKHFHLKPRLTKQLAWVKASTESPYGLIRSQWNNDADSFTWEVEIPTNTTATVFIPCFPESEVTEGGRAIDDNASTINEGRHQWRQRDLGSGVYRFVVKSKVSDLKGKRESKSGVALD